MFNARKIFNCESNKFCNNRTNNFNNNCNNICPKGCNCYNFKKCVKKGSVLDSLYCVENFLCCSQKACNLYKLICFFK